MLPNSFEKWLWLLRHRFRNCFSKALQLKAKVYRCSSDLRSRRSSYPLADTDEQISERVVQEIENDFGRDSKNKLSLRQKRKLATNNNIETIWLELTDVEVEGEWRNCYGHLQTYFSWAPNEPNDKGGEDYGSLRSDGEWNDGDGGELNEPLCTHVLRGTSP